MRVTISVESNGQLISVDVPGSLLLEDFKAYLSAETDIEPTKQILQHNESTLTDLNKTLEELGIQDDEIVVLKSTPNRPTPPSSGGASVSAPSSGNAVDLQIEQTRLQFLNNPQLNEQLSRTRPDLHSLLNDPARFKDIMLQQLEQVQQTGGYGISGHRQEELRRLQANPDDPDNQAKILEMIRQEQIEENMKLAYEITPESFAQVDMLFINIKVNGENVQAFVDSGAQTTIISPRLAEKVGIARLIDRRFQGEARGVGSQRIEGKIHSVPISIGDSNIEIPCSFMVIDTSVDLLFGLDMLRRHKCIIDLEKDKLIVGGHIETKFLPASEVQNNGMFGGSGGGQRGSGLGGNIFSDTRPANSTPSNEPVSSSAASSAVGAAAVSRSGPSAATTAAPVAAAPPKEEDITRLIDLGFSRSEAITALKQTNGNVDLAASLLFQ